MPGRPAYLALHTHQTSGRGSLFGADTDRVGQHCQWLTIAFKLKKPHCGQVDHDAFSGGVRQDKAHRQHNAFSGLRHPYICPWISCTDSIEPQAEVPCNIRQRIPLFEADESQSTDDIIIFCNRNLVSFDTFLQMFWNKLVFVRSSSHRNSTSIES